MDFELTGGQRDLVEQTRDYAERVVRPAAARLEQVSRAEDFPFDLMREGTALGLMTLRVGEHEAERRLSARQGVTASSQGS